DAGDRLVDRIERPREETGLLSGDDVERLRIRDAFEISPGRGRSGHAPTLVGGLEGGGDVARRRPRRVWNRQLVGDATDERDDARSEEPSVAHRRLDA